MKIHEGKKLKHRKTPPKVTVHTDYYNVLSEDFQGLCGYCGKDSNTFHRKHQIDHFIPINYDKNFRLAYTNLILACPKCNRGKSAFWPTKSKTISHNGVVGFVKPTLEDYNNHLRRNTDGSIRALTPVGNYMYEKFKFNIRPIELTWKAMKVDEELKSFEKKGSEIKDIAKFKLYMDLNIKFRNLKDILFEGREIV